MPCLFLPQLALVTYALAHKPDVEMGVVRASTAEDYPEDHSKCPRGKLLPRTCLLAWGAGAAGWRGIHHHSRGKDHSLEGRVGASTLQASVGCHSLWDFLLHHKAFCPLRSEEMGKDVIIFINMMKPICVAASTGWQVLEKLFLKVPDLI